MRADLVGSAVIGIELSGLRLLSETTLESRVNCWYSGDANASDLDEAHAGHRAQECILLSCDENAWTPLHNNGWAVLFHIVL